MQALEFTRKTGLFSKSYALGLVVALGSNTTLESEFRHIKETVLQWVAKRGKTCGAIRLTVVLSPGEIPANKAVIDQVFREEADLGPIFQRLPFAVYFVDAHEQLLEEYVPKPHSGRCNA
jgi:hypothetical protein